MDDILDEIVTNTRKELASRKRHTPLPELKEALRDAPRVRDFARTIIEKHPIAVIGEVKKSSPSRGLLRRKIDPAVIAREYASAGAAAVSVLTDEKFFGGRLEHLDDVRAAVTVPVLRKDFIVDAYQVYESRVHGADAVLLITEVLSTRVLRSLLRLVHDLDMQALVESHDREHLDKALAADARIIGINNRDLRTFRVDIATTERLAGLVPADRVLVSESGIACYEDVKRCIFAGVKAVLVGETLMRADDIPGKMRELMGPY